MLVLAIAVALMVCAARRRPDVGSFGVAVTCAVLVTPSLFHHYLSILVLPMLLSLASGTGGGWVAAGYLAMWGRQQAALGPAAALLDRVLPWLGALAVVVSSLRHHAAADRAADASSTGVDVHETGSSSHDRRAAGAPRRNS